MTLAHARALLPAETEVFDHQPREDAQALVRLAQWMIRFAPLVAADPPDGIILNISGCERLYGGERRLLNAVGNSLEWLGFRVRAAAASTIGCAWGAARYSRHDRIVIEDGEELEALAELPLESLRLEENVIDALHEVGVVRVEELLRIPRLELAARFGSDVLLRIDQAGGEAIETINPLRAVQPPRCERIFDGPVKQIEVIDRTARELLRSIIQQLIEREAGARELLMRIERIGITRSGGGSESDGAKDDRVCDFIIRLSRPSRDERHLWSMLRPKVEGLHMGFGIERIELVATSIDGIEHQQIETDASPSWSATEHLDDDDDPRSIERAAGELTDVLAQRLGERSIMRMMPRESHIPEHGFMREAAAHVASIPATASLQVCPADRPPLLLARMQLIRVIVVSPEGPLLQMRWRGETHRIITTIGPERIEEEWWSDGAAAGREHSGSAMPASTRDYYKVQIETGRWLWLCRALRTGRWFVHGFWG